ncbi:MAG: ABC transporter substrate-binding protein [Deltaproteobacteria bacterium]|nr:ABC transporter substrate-binding protein [Deltaproteobacteria bacterium]
MKEKMHSAVKALKSDFQKGKMTRREFIRFTTLLGVSAAAATQMAGLAFPARVLAGPVKRGGTLKVAAPVHKVTHPAQFSWISPTNQMRQVAEYLTYTDGDNITHPYLLENWQASDDLKTWALNLRKGIKHNNGDTFNADDVVFTFNQWLDKDVGSSMKGMLSYLDAGGIEKVSDHQVKLHLKNAEIAVPEHLFHYPAMVLNHRTFEGDFIKAPHGTGPYTIESYVEGERCVLKRRSDYWKKGGDGNPLPYLDKIEFIDMGTEMGPMIAAIQAGEIDLLDFGDIGGTEAYQALKSDARVNVQAATTNQTRILRMRVDMKPWSDNRVRSALKLCQHREKILALAYFGQGMEGQDVHVSPKHPEYCPIDTPKYDPMKAKQLLTEAGYPNGLDVNLAVGSGWSEIVRYAEILKQDAAPAGFRINIQTMPNSQYWEKWTEVDLGITTWAHRPIGTMVPSLAYVGDENGKPVAWNETRWVDKEYSELLTRANGTLDVEARRKIFCKLEKIQQERGSIGNAFWINVWTISRKPVQGVKPHPSLYLKLDDVWMS